METFMLDNFKMAKDMEMERWYTLLELAKEAFIKEVGRIILDLAKGKCPTHK